MSRIQMIKKFASNYANSIKKLSENDNVLSGYQLGQLNAYENIVMIIEAIESHFNNESKKTSE